MALPNRQGSWPFCPQCGSIFNAPENDLVRCLECSFECPYEQLGVGVVVTMSAPVPRPNWLDKNIGDDGMKSTKDRNALIEEICPKCGNPEMYFYTMQLRSADEGSTVFYECPSCDHKFSANN